jgi:hypothetical protein
VAVLTSDLHRTTEALVAALEDVYAALPEELDVEVWAAWAAVWRPLSVLVEYVEDEA